MEIFTNRNRIKRISLILIILTVLTSVLPLYSIYAGDTEDPASQAQEEEAMTDEEVGGKLFRPIFKLFAGVGDLVVKGLQKIFLGDGDIKGRGIKELDRDDATFFIRYSPAVIFSNTIPGLDANFINPKDAQPAKKVTGTASEVEKGLSLDDSRLKNTYGFDISTLTPQYTKTNNGFFNIRNAEEHLQYTWVHNGKQYSLVNTTNIPDLDIYKLQVYGSLIVGTGGAAAIPIILAEIIAKNDDGADNWNLYEYKVDSTDIGKTLKSTAGELQGTVSKWYKSLRLFALVGLLSVLVYIGIRILISSTGQEKAKYKKMIMDWIAAICILFMLQYIMSFTMTIVENLTEVFKAKVIDDNGVDILMSNIRQNINLNAMSGITSFSCLIMYLALVVYTVVFTVHYLKRLVYLAFFTMIAPLIAFTYPLDKIKDGQAQAFGMWIKEYIFNALIPVLHMLIYSMFVGTALDLAISNPLYAIVCIAFLMPAEKFMRKMFGFDKATTSGQLGAAAGGAMVMNAINKIGHKPPKAGPENPAKVRTTGSGGNTGGYAIGGLDSPGGAGPLGGARPLEGAGPLGGANPPGGARPLEGANPTGGARPLEGANPTGGAGPLGGVNPTRGGRVKSAFKRALKTPVAQGLNNVRKRYINRNTPKKIGKGLGRGLRRGLVGAAGAAALGTFGLAAGVASGDLGNVAKYTGAAMAAGGVGAARLSDIAAKEEKQNREAFKQGYFGKEEYEARDTIEQVWQNQDISDQYKIGKKSQFKEDAREFTDSGITDKNEIIAAMQMKEQHPGLTNSDAVTIAKLNKKVSKGTYGNPSKTTTINRVKREIAKSLRNQGFTGDADQEAARQIRLMDAMKQNLNKL